MRRLRTHPVGVGVVATAVFASACTPVHPTEHEIGADPIVASPERAASIRRNYSRVATGMTASEVAAILGEPDEVRVLYEPDIKRGDALGQTHWYVIQRAAPVGGVIAKEESLVRIAYGNDDRVRGIDAWGL